jgi:heptosyltransferase-2
LHSPSLDLEPHIATFHAASNVIQVGNPVATAVIQVKPGIGDVIWHLPFIRAIAAAATDCKVAFLAPPTSQARDLLAAEPGVTETIYFDHAGSQLQRGLNLMRLAALLRRRRFRSIWILDRTTRPAIAARLAGIPQRIGLGLGGQQFFITNAGVDHSHFHDHPIDWLRALMAAMNVPLPSTEPGLRLDPATMTAIGGKFTGLPRPWIALGIGASHPDKDWPDSHWAKFISALRERMTGTVFLIGGSANQARAQRFIDACPGAAAVNACDLSLMRATALLQHADLFVGPSSGPLNLAAAVQTEAFGLFGSTPVLTYSKFIHALVPDGGPMPGGMALLAPEQAIVAITPYLARTKAPA